MERHDNGRAGSRGSKCPLSVHGFPAHFVRWWWIAGRAELKVRLAGVDTLVGRHENVAHAQGTHRCDSRVNIHAAAAEHGHSAVVRGCLGNKAHRAHELTWSLGTPRHHHTPPNGCTCCCPLLDRYNSGPGNSMSDKGAPPANKVNVGNRKAPKTRSHEPAVSTGRSVARNTHLASWAGSCTQERRT